MSGDAGGECSVQTVTPDDRERGNAGVMPVETTSVRRLHPTTRTVAARVY